MPVYCRFAQFFLEPLFEESVTQREVNAVNSEHEKNIPSDLWRIRQLEKCMSKPGHAYNHFSTGFNFLLIFFESTMQYLEYY